MASNEEFFAEFLQEVHGRAGAAGRFIEDEWFEAFCEQIVDAGDLDTADRAFYTNQRGIRVDGYGGDPHAADGVLTLLVADFSAKPDLETLTRTEMEAGFKRLQAFLSKCLERNFVDSLEETSPAFGLGDLIRVRWPEINKVRLILLTNKVLSSRVDGLKATEVLGVPVAQSVWDLGRLRQFVESGHGREEIEVDLVNEFGGGIPVLSAHTDLVPYRAFLAVVPGTQLAAIYDRWGPRLLEQNVRVFLQARGGVNKGIRATLENEPGMFFAYNNGLTATAEGIETKQTPTGLVITALKNLQIVNGGQSTASIHAASRRNVDLSEVYVQMKLAIVSPDQVIDLVPKISEYANTQNKVAAADFFANHPFHIRMQQFSRRLFAPAVDGTVKQTKWFYERARGQYQDDRAAGTPTQKRKFDAEYPKRQLISKTDLSKYLMVWEGHPHTVSLGAQKNFAEFAKRVGAEWERAEDQFNEAYFRHAVAKAIVFRHLERRVSEQPWYDGGYRANIVAYTLAKLGNDVAASRNEVDFDRVWREQSVSAPLDSALLAGAEAIHLAIVNPPAGSRNVSEWAKQQACWSRVAGLEIEWPEDLSRALVAKSESVARQRDAEAVQRIDNGIEAQTAVIEAGAKAWADVKEWGVARRLLTPDDVSFLEVCASIPRKVPSEKQCARALAILRRLHSEGCPLLPKLR